ncbi:MAG: YIP1 family protein [Candidatus Korobacteraceae bacterium]
MATFSQRIVGAATLNVPTYEEVENDTSATGQAMAVVVLSSISAGIGLWHGLITTFITGVVSALIAWLVWAVLVYLIGTKILPQPQTQADVSQLLRTLGFAAAPGLLRFLGIIPILGPVFLLAISVWMLVAMIVAVRQALDYTSTLRALGVAVIGWLISIVVSLVLFRPVMF